MITEQENLNNYSRLQAIVKRVSRQISLEALYHAAKVVQCDYEIDIPLATVNNMKAEFALLRNEIKELENNING